MITVPCKVRSTIANLSEAILFLVIAVILLGHKQYLLISLILCKYFSVIQFHSSVSHLQCSFHSLCALLCISVSQFEE